MVASGRRDVDQMLADATRLDSTPVPIGPKPVKERDREILGALDWLVSSAGMTIGARASHWKEACRQRGLGSRRAWEAASARLLAAGLVRRVGARFMPANAAAGE